MTDVKHNAYSRPGAREAPATSASRACVERERAVSTSAATQSEAV
jgi:hypothetical protein